MSRTLSARIVLTLQKLTEPVTTTELIARLERLGGLPSRRAVVVTLNELHADGLVRCTGESPDRRWALRPG